jgi:[ribosomal protein S5]-alanine N-acetyltransferase
VSTRLETSRLIIRMLERRDAEPYLAMVTDPEVIRYLPPAPPATMATARAAIESRHAMEAELGYAMWAVEDKTTGAFVGQCGLRAVDEDYGPEIDLAYHYLRTSWNKGYGTEAVIAVLGHGLGSIGLDRIVAVAMAGNVGSWRVMEKSGMRYEGLATYSGMADLKKYAAERQWWQPPIMHRAAKER